MFEIIKVFKNGNGLAINLPVKLSRGLEIERGDVLIYAVAEGDVICLRKLKNEEKVRVEIPVINM